MATAVAVLLLVAIGLLVSRSGNGTPTASPSAGKTSASSPSSRSGSGSSDTQQAAPPANAETGGSAASTGSGATGSSGSVGSSGPGTTGIQGARASNPLPNTGAPFPWWLGLFPLALGILLIAALRRRPAAALSPRSRTVSFDTSISLPPPSRIRAGEKWLFADELDELERELPKIEGERPLVGGRVF
ncbi:MAG: hypothetical protein ACRDJU_11060 [Actinomycetota bacterium]